MKKTYMSPQVDVVDFAPGKAIAMEQPGWGWEEDVFSTPEPQNINNENMEGGEGNEG